MKNFIEEIIETSNTENLRFRFPPEPNGFLHIGHAKALHINFSLAEKSKAPCNLRMDDTNPLAESEELEKSIINDVEWLGYNYDGEVKRASNYLPDFKKFAVDLIKKGKAYIDTSSSEEIASKKGTTNKPGKNSNNRNLSCEDNLRLWVKVCEGRLKGVLRAKIDMSHPNLLMRDPVIFRYIDGFGMYPTYDFAHPLSDYIEKITHSLCTLEFVEHRPLYNWVLNSLELKGRLPVQIEFSRLNLSHTIMSKRNILKLIENDVVESFEDPRLPTISGLRNRGFTPSSIRKFCEKVGVTKFNGVTEYALLEHFLREELNKTAPRIMAVTKPLLVKITNLHSPLFVEVENNPENKDEGKRTLLLSNKIWIESDDFKKEPEKKFFRLSVGSSVRLKGGAIITCESFEVNEKGEIAHINCKLADNNTKVKSTIHWVDYTESIPVEIREYEHLFNSVSPGKETGDFMDDINPESLKVFNGFCEEAATKINGNVQFLRKGYYFKVNNSNKITFNKTVSLKSSF